MRKKGLFLLSLACCMIFAGETDNKSFDKVNNFENDPNILGVYKTLSSMFFKEGVVINPNGECYYSMTSDVKSDEPEPRNVKGTYTIKGNIIDFGHGPREIRIINSVYTFWRDDAIRDWDEKREYRSYGIMLKCLKTELKVQGKPDKTRVYYYGNDVERILNNEVKGIDISKNEGQVLNLIPDKLKKEFKRESPGTMFITIDRGKDSWYGKECYEYTPGKDGFHSKSGIHITYFPNSKQIESIEEYKNGSWTGPSFVFYRNGQVQFKQYFKNGDRDGFCQHWNRKGQLTSQGEYKAGKLINGTERKPDFNKETDSEYILVEYKDGKRIKITPCDEEGNIDMLNKAGSEPRDMEK